MSQDGGEILRHIMARLAEAPPGVAAAIMTQPDEAPRPGYIGRSMRAEIDAALALKAVKP